MHTQSSIHINVPICKQQARLRERGIVDAQIVAASVRSTMGVLCRPVKMLTSHARIRWTLLCIQLIDPCIHAPPLTPIYPLSQPAPRRSTRAQQDPLYQPKSLLRIIPLSIATRTVLWVAASPYSSRK